MHTRALTALPGLAVVLLLTGCGHDNRIVVRDPAPAAEAESMFVDQPLPPWHPALPEGHPPISGEECPAGGMSDFGDIPTSRQPVPETIST